MIVISRFIFSYEQAFMADLVRFWYGALFLFASAYTLLEDDGWFPWGFCNLNDDTIHSLSFGRCCGLPR